MTPDEFCRIYDKRVSEYATRTARRFALPDNMAYDLHQVCYIAIISKLKKWRPDGGLSAFNWCASGMRKHMIAEIKRYHGNKAWTWRREIVHFLESSGDHDYGACDPDPVTRIDLERVLNEDPKPHQVQVFIEAHHAPKSGSDIARKYGLSRQAINYTVHVAQARLLRACQQKGITP